MALNLAPFSRWTLRDKAAQRLVSTLDNMTSRFSRFAGYFGYGMQFLAFLFLLAWIQNRDPDCYLTTGVFLQLRLCGPEYVAQPDGYSLIGLAASVALFVIGRVFVTWSQRRTKK